jgi:hypothetical protein
MVAYTCNPSYLRSWGSGITILRATWATQQDKKMAKKKKFTSLGDSGISQKEQESQRIGFKSQLSCGILERVTCPLWTTSILFIKWTQWYLSSGEQQSMWNHLKHPEDWPVHFRNLMKRSFYIWSQTMWGLET